MRVGLCCSLDLCQSSIGLQRRWAPCVGSAESLTVLDAARWRMTLLMSA